MGLCMGGGLYARYYGIFFIFQQKSENSNARFQRNSDGQKRETRNDNRDKGEFIGPNPDGGRRTKNEFQGIYFHGFSHEKASIFGKIRKKYYFTEFIFVDLAKKFCGNLLAQFFAKRTAKINLCEIKFPYGIIL